MGNYNKNSYFLKIIIGLVTFSLTVVSPAALAAEDAGGAVKQADEQKNNSNKQRNDRVLDNRAARSVFRLTQNLPGILEYAPPAPKTAATPQPQDAAVPIVIEADRLSYNDETGDILAYGQVIITKNGAKIETDELNGNTKNSRVWTRKPVLFTYGQDYLNSSDIFYDYSQNTGQVGESKGKINRQFVTGKQINILPGHYVATQATATNCPAKIPDYHISAEKIEIWPDNKMIIHKAKFLIKNHVIFAMDKYQASLKKNETDRTPFPQVGYRRSDGLYLEQHLEYPLSRTTSLFTDLKYYSKWNFRPSYGIQDSRSNYTAQIVTGHFVDGDNHWVKKLPEFRWDYHPRRIGATAFSYRFGFSYGRWLGESKTSWHQSYNLYLNHDPISLSKTTFLYFGGGVEHIRESYDKSRQNVPKIDITLTKSFSDRLNAWVSYHYKKYEKQPIFNYSVPDISQEINYGFTYKIDRLNSIGVTYRYDQDKHSLNDIYYTWHRNMHCWDSVLTYKSKARNWEWTMNVVHW